ncbi:hypothetical protein BDY19DRAFT_990761 [Irpex rosettiformis]|uniref:Uncharacterized protein n=1 Tax=Irpex rosettiformis TaxID=378272 RepID=A0ACB8UCF8_9APHY|nr:hypothetical protein BDY19DRAFT_990761 [Irpex rosettiformis]
MAKQRELVTGYYRLTDIVWEWHQVLPDPTDIGPLKAVIGWEALVHPDHPLRKPDQDGLELFIGMFENGEARLLMSSAQVSYISYYLHAMGLTKQPIPIPSSRYLIKRSTLKSCAPDYYNTAAALRKSMKSIDKANKRLRGLGVANNRLTGRRMDFERVRSYWVSKRGTWIAFDFESWEREHSMLLEVGWSLLRWDAGGKETNKPAHLIVKERMQYQNGTYVQGNRDHYNFGQSEQVHKSVVKDRVRSIINEAQERGPVFLVFHDSSQDIKDLTREDVAGHITGLSYRLPDQAPSTGTFVVDTVDLFAALEGNTGANKWSLEQTCRQLQVLPLENLHNAGNDAHYTMLALKSMAEGGPLDSQRQQRWPAYISVSGLGADLPGVDGNPDVEELEGPNTRNLVSEPTNSSEDVDMEES